MVAGMGGVDKGSDGKMSSSTWWCGAWVRLRFDIVPGRLLGCPGMWSHPSSVTLEIQCLLGVLLEVSKDANERAYLDVHVEVLPGR